MISFLVTHLFSMTISLATDFFETVNFSPSTGTVCTVVGVKESDEGGGGISDDDDDLLFCEALLSSGVKYL